MSAAETRAAIAEQEEHVKRNTSCGGVLGAPHSWDRYSTAPGGPTYRACLALSRDRDTRGLSGEACRERDPMSTTPDVTPAPALSPLAVAAYLEARPR